MKIIVRVDTDNVKHIEKILEGLKEDICVLPHGDSIKMFVITDSGEVVDLK